MLLLEADLQIGIKTDPPNSNWDWFQNQVALRLKTFELTEIGVFRIKFSDSGKRFLKQLRRASV